MSNQNTSNLTLRIDIDQSNTMTEDGPSGTSMALGRANRSLVTGATTVPVESPWNHVELVSFKVDDDFMFSFPTDFDEQDPLFAQSEDNATFTITNICKRLALDTLRNDLDAMAYEFFSDCKKHSLNRISAC